MAHARSSLDGGDAEQESQYGTFLATSLGLEGLKIGAKRLWVDLGLDVSIGLGPNVASRRPFSN